MKLLKQSLLMSAWLTLLLGLAYPYWRDLRLGGILFPGKANVAFVSRGGAVVVLPIGLGLR